MMMKPFVLEKWLNLKEGNVIDLEYPSIKFVHFFQMLCPGCIQFGIPETVEVFHKYEADDFRVFGVHSVFENHEFMQEEALAKFLHQHSLPFPVAIDKHGPGQWMPITMKNYDLQGTPSTVIIDRKGEIRLKHFGHFDRNKLFGFLDRLKAET